MNVKKLVLATAILSAVGGIVGCSEGDETTIDIDSTSTTGGSSSSTASDCPSWASIRPKDGDGNDVCQLPSTVMVDRTLTSDTVWYLDGTVTVGNGNQEMSVTQGTLEGGGTVANVTLTIQAGTEIKGATGSFANIIITRGSKIEAVGTASAPIIFSSDDDGYDGSGEWGGLILHGYGEHNVCDNPAVACNIDAEGESGFAGGYTEDDDSGTLSYVIVTEGGYEFAVGNEINGISFVAVGSGTQVDHIQVNANADDGVEFYGGDVDVKYAVITGALDDSVDWDEGWQGDMQFVLVKQSADSGGNTIEADTEGKVGGFLSKPTIANATFIGDGSKDVLAVFKKASGGFVHHSVFTFNNSGTTCIDSTEGGLSDGSSAAHLAFTNVIADCTTSGDTDLIAEPTLASVALDSKYASLAPEASVGALDISGINSSFTESVADPAFFDVTTYAGAVDPSATTPWYAGWTLDGTL